VVPDETTILRSRHLVEQHGLTQAISIRSPAAKRTAVLLRLGTIVHATIIAALNSTKNAGATQDPRDETD
jgi:IS5 family transposase